MRSPRSRMIAAFMSALACAPLLVERAAAQDYPLRLIKIIVPFPPGGNPDLAARLVAHRMAIDFGQPVIVENRPGANGGVGAGMVAKAGADGYTLLVANLGILGINPGIYDRLSYDPARDFIPIGRLAISSLLLIASSALPVDSVQTLIAAAKQDPGKLSYSSSGVGSAAHMAGALFDQMAGTEMLHVPYKGASEATTAVASDTISVVFGGQGAAWALVASGKVRALALSGSKRSPMHPEAVTVAEAGVPGYEIADWVGMLAPRGTPQAVIDRLNAEIGRALGDAETEEKFALQGLEPAATTEHEFAVFIDAEQKKWAAVAKKSNIRIAQ
jgi:tripartite-type tricarboxylate transporter receptor subunit TctC